MSVALVGAGPPCRDDGAAGDRDEKPGRAWPGPSGHLAAARACKVIG